MKNLERICNIIAYPFTGLGIGLTLLYLLPAILPSFDTGTKINGDKMKITKRKGAFSTVSFIKDKYKNKISIYNFNGFSKGYGLINLRDDKRDTSKYAENDFIFKEADKIYKEEIEKFKE